jgi:hypothetical protein
MKTLEALSLVSLATVFLSIIFFMGSEVAELAPTLAAQIQSLMMVSLSLGLTFLGLSYIITRLSSKPPKSQTLNK